MWIYKNRASNTLPGPFPERIPILVKCLYFNSAILSTRQQSGETISFGIGCCLSQSLHTTAFPHTSKPLPTAGKHRGSRMHFSWISGLVHHVLRDVSPGLGPPRAVYRGNECRFGFVLGTGQCQPRHIEAKECPRLCKKPLEIVPTITEHDADVK